MDDRRWRTPLGSDPDEIDDERDLEAELHTSDLEVDAEEDGLSTLQHTPSAVPPPAPGKWLDEARTTYWNTEDKPDAAQEPSPSVLRPRERSAVSRARQTGSSAVRRSQSSRSAYARSPTGWSPDALVPYDGSDELSDGRPMQQRLIEAPIRIKVAPVARISPDPQLCLMTKPHSPAAEQYRVLALKLREDRAARVVAVAGVNRGADAALAAANLALSFAESSRTRVALVDVDLRGSKLAKLFELNEGAGLGEQIRQHRRDPSQLWTTISLTANLQLLPAGPTERNPAALLSSEVVEDLMHELRRYYDFIVLAAPPIMESADVNILQEYVDGILLVVHAGVTRRPAVSASISRLGENRFLGALLLDVAPRRQASR